MDVRLETDRLILRRYREDDFDVYAAMQADPEVARFLGGVRDLAGAREHFDKAQAHWRSKGYGKFAVEEKVSGLMVGRVGPTLHGDEPEIELGWAMARAAWGRGYATEAACTCADWMFRTLALDEIVSFIDPANTASIRVAEKLGQTHARDMLYDGEPLRVYAVSRSDFIGV